MAAGKATKKAKDQLPKPLPDAATPTSPATAATFPVIGIGASAGGLAAFEAFFSGMPVDADPGMAFVLVQHLAPDHGSILAELIRRYTRMQVFDVIDGMVVQPNCAYIIPPNRDMALLNGALQLLEPSMPRGQRLPIDFFFRSLAQDQHERAIGIVLSGTGSDGTQGLRAIKGEGGMVIAQHPASAEFDGMPRSAIATGLVDYQLPPAEMPAQLIAYANLAFSKSGPPVSKPNAESASALKRIFVLLRAQTGHDFSHYKPSTINRRIERRMAVHQITTLENYIKYLQQTAAEAEALFRDILIGVTSFFRDPDAFAVLEAKIIPRLFADQPPGSLIRVWSPGCSTGEEAYSIAILLHEHLATLKQNYVVQIFATDIDSRAIAAARSGLYPASVVASLSAERLAHFFKVEGDGNTYRIHKSIRDMLVFSEHDVIKDPPFSRLDLISCRNLLIYMDGELQKKLISLFHYALNPGGMLFLGTSEGVGELDEAFTVLDRKAKLYERKESFHGAPRAALPRLYEQTTAFEAARPHRAGKAAASLSPARLPLRELTEQALLLQVAPAAALLNGQGDILYLHGRTGRYLEPAPGEAGVNNILRMAREGLQHELTLALHRAAGQSEPVRCAGLRVKTNGHFTRVNLSVHQVTVSTDATMAPLYLAILEDAPESDEVVAGLPALTPDASDASGGCDPDADCQQRITALTRELLAKEGFLNATNAALKDANQELKSSGEEMQSVNEELQSTNEELETSKEELQSVNEELSTVNTELQTKVADLSRANNDMNNLLAGTGIATIFLDRQLRIVRFTPMAAELINLIHSDIGRPIGHILTNLVDYRDLMADARAVLDTLRPKAQDVEASDGKWYTLRIQPYRTLDNVVEGVVITFADVSEIVLAREALQRLAVVVHDAQDAITVQDMDGRILAWNLGATRIFGWNEDEALKMNVRDRVPLELRQAAIDRLLRLGQAEVMLPFTTQRNTKAGGVVDVSLTATALLDAQGKVYAIATTERLIAATPD